MQSRTASACARSSRGSSYTARCTSSDTRTPKGLIAPPATCGAARRRSLPQSLEALVADFEAGKSAALARAVSVVENHRAGYDELMTRLHPHIGRAQRLGITGPPGAGKSTVTNLIVQSLRQEGHTVGVIAVDPTSPFTGGALLGDRVRMESVALDPGVYIRSM